ncbi:MAG: glycine--tRNA ligase subunit beta [Acidobacteria bacterium]|nr:glycine--tRNA ligase subunit beta [Acidobacteriota bacterium]MBI3664169.1 glycine--tRNA ligase subunit beta [Acidobacteriota bacterium]
MKKRNSKVATADFLFEIGCEEIPAGMLQRAASELKVILEKHFSANNLLNNSVVETFGAPRRLVAACDSLRLRQPDVVREITGPPRSVAFDDVGRPTRAAESFAAKQGVRLEDLAVISTARGDYLAAKQVIKGRPAAEILREILPRMIAEIPWPRSMYWASAEGPRFIRPVRWVVALLGGRTIPFTFGEVAAGNFSAGHRFLGKPKVPVKGLKDYHAKLRASFVLANPAERRRKIEREIHALLVKRGLRAHADPGLLDLVTYLNEYPTVILGDFSEEFLDLPDEILVTVMRDHQKYFAVERRDGSLAAHFLAVINMDSDRQGLVRAGHERVLRARFADARFFWQHDLKCRLADNLSRLQHVTYESRLGSYAAKVARLKSLAGWFAGQWFNSGILQADVAGSIRAAELAKCDLVTGMVGEFPELQGIVGGLYAKEQGEPDEVAWAVYDHYRPLGLDESIPRNLTGCSVALADKLDALVGCFAVGMIPSGSSDPFALRRAALGIVKIILERKVPVSLSASISAAAGILESQPPKIRVSPQVQAQVLEFIAERARFVFKERLGFAYDEVSATLAAGADDLVDAERRLAALKAIRKTKNFEPLATAFKRIRKIIEKAGPVGSWKLSAVREDALVEEAERKLHADSRKVAREAGEHKRGGRYREALQVIAGLRPAVDQFFDRVLVMAEDEQLRKNRLTLLAELLEEFSTIADFSEIVTTEK